MPSHELGPFSNGKGLNAQLITSLSLTIVKSLFDFDPASDGSKELDSMTSLLPLNFKSVLCVLNYGPIMLIKESNYSTSGIVLLYSLHKAEIPIL